MTKEEIQDIILVFKKFDEDKANLTDFLYPIIHEMGFDSITDIVFGPDNIFVGVEWNGDYGAHDTETLSFPISLLETNQVEIINYLDNRKKERWAQIQKLREEEKIKNDLALLKNLQEKYNECRV